MPKRLTLTERRKKWLRALRSGKYKQARSNLRDGNRFCCLGVACDLSKLGKWDGVLYVIDEERSIEMSLAEDEAGLKWLGIDADTDRKAMNMNDGEGDWKHKPQTFKQIADYFAKKWRLK